MSPISGEAHAGPGRAPLTEVTSDSANSDRADGWYASSAAPHCPAPACDCCGPQVGAGAKPRAVPAGHDSTFCPVCLNRHRALHRRQSMSMRPLSSPRMIDCLRMHLDRRFEVTCLNVHLFLVSCYLRYFRPAAQGLISKPYFDFLNGLSIVAQNISPFGTHGLTPRKQMENPMSIFDLSGRVASHRGNGGIAWHRAGAGGGRMQRSIWAATPKRTGRRRNHAGCAGQGPTPGSHSAIPLRSVCHEKRLWTPFAGSRCFANAASRRGRGPYRPYEEEWRKCSPPI